MLFIWYMNKHCLYFYYISYYPLYTLCLCVTFVCICCMYMLSFSCPSIWFSDCRTSSPKHAAEHTIKHTWDIHQRQPDINRNANTPKLFLLDCQTKSKTWVQVGRTRVCMCVCACVLMRVISSALHHHRVVILIFSSTFPFEMSQAVNVL